ncbi:serine hydrolase domain-containing protein [Shewanella litorisediminis]|uniref:Beta-lactamase family protein n=1 Tax=Shewanella litorisediminis TaxID=1173586 RepID=A0ABX7G0Q5_9GAMM|nr:serine hydrolase domain-containing protein [Shewanella litorisediminis]MCL2919861.1 beta-lactamase family protein [Shewanella litorisediminis]QRH00902.1 beta-lactamase family protein [Shewanella litorisediminis]
MKITKGLFKLAFYLSSLLVSSAAQAKELTELKAALNAQISNSFQGIIWVQHQDRKLFVKAAGDGIKEDSLFILGSVSKPVFSSFYLSRHLQSLNSPLTVQQKPAFYPEGRRLTPAMLLSHSSGINRGFTGMSSDEPGHFEYSNGNYQFLANGLNPGNSAAWLSDLNHFLNTNALDIKATAGHTQTLRQIYPRLVQGFNEQANQREVAELALTTASAASGTLIGSAKGVADFQQKLHTGQLLPDSAYQAMVTPMANRDHRWGTLEYGLGLQIAQSPLEYSHSGYLPGFMSLMLYYPDTQLLLVLLQNISGDLNNPDAVFAFHDQVRTLMRSFASLPQPANADSISPEDAP